MKQGLEANSSLSHYRIVSQLGAGGMGEVWLAEDTRLDRKVALKLLPTEFTQDANRVRRFTLEAKAASALNHPNIVTVHDIGQSESGRFIVMELIAGRTLRTLTSAANSIETLLALGTQIAKALSAAHEAGIVHRDLKPDNIMVRDDGYVKVLDFGLARLQIESETDPEAPTLAQQTMPGQLVGTAAYMSPEQASGLSASYPADIFSLGIVLYELATGQHPFRSETLLGYLHAISFQSAAPPSRLNREIPVALNDFILRMLEKEPSRRPTAEEVVRTLQQLARHGGGDGTSHSSFVEALGRNTVGRAAERTELRGCFKRVTNGHGALLCVVGEPGSGKTTLVEDFLAELAASNQCLIARGRCSERLAGAEAYLPWLEALESLLQSGSLVQVMKHLAPTWYAQLVPLSGASEESTRLLEEVKAASQERMKRELAGLLQAACESRPLVLFFDDLHWADVSTVDLLNFLGGKLDSLKVLIVTTYRPSDMLLSKHPFLQVKPDLQARGLCRELLLEFLTESEVGEYLTLEFPAHRFPVELPKLIHAKTEGSPLFMADVVRYLRERGVIANTNGVWTLAQTLPDIDRELPESVRGMIERKIAQLSEEDRKLLTVASVQGYEFDSAVAAQVVGLDSDEVEERLEKLERIFAFVKLASEGEFPDRTLTLKYRFVHVLYQNSLYNLVRATRKTTLSRSVAQTLENFYGKKKSEIAIDLALLWESARENARAAEYFLQAARNAARIFADAETTALAQRGLTNVNRLPQSSERSRMELRLQITLGAALMTINTYASSVVKQVYLRSEELCKELVDDRQLFRVQFGLSIICAVRGEYERALSLAEECLRLAERMTDEDLMAQAHWACGLSLQYPGQYAACLTHLEKTVAMGELLRDAPNVSLQKKIAAVFSQGHLAVVLLYMGWPEKAEALKQSMLVRQSVVTHPLSHADNLYLAATVEVFHNRIAEVKRLSEVILQYAQEQGLKWYIAVGQMLRGWATVKEDSVEDGLAQLRQGLSAYRATETELSLTFFLALSADALTAAGVFKEAADSLTEALALAERTGERYYESELHRLEGELVLRRHDDDFLSLAGQAEAAFQSAIQVSSRQKAKSLELRATVSLARLWKQQGKSAQAKQVLAETYGWFSEGFEAPDLGDAKALLDELESLAAADVSASFS